MTPRATYRLQFRKDFGFARAAEIAPYLAQLGVSHVYASPWLKARPGSTHGYDIVDHHTLNPDLGSEEDFQRMIEAFAKNGLRQILDFVPNHMGVGGSDNPLWLDVLEWGPDSAYAHWFDIDWHHDRTRHQDKLLVPFLGNQYGTELYTGRLRLNFDEHEGSFAVWAYNTHKLPICPHHYSRILGEEHPELERFGDAFANLPEWRPQVGLRAGELKQELAQSVRDHDDVRAAVRAALNRFNGMEANEESWRDLDSLIRDQFWRAADFRAAADDINYRRFFNINDLAGIRQEIPAVFEHSHQLVFRLLENTTLDGLRIDHVDGLLDPKGYLERLRAHRSPDAPQFYLVVEKILSSHESLREDWPVDGTTGYEFLNLVLGLLIDSAGEQVFTRTYLDFTGERQPFGEVVHESKLRIMRNEMASELNVLAREAARVAQQNPKTADFTRNLLRRAIREIIACFPVYRTYVDFRDTPTDEDRRDLAWALKTARAREKDLDPDAFDFLASLLSGDLVAQPHSGFSRHGVLRLAMKLQQYSGPVMAKGLEDTAFYRYNRFVALNEVGGHPDQFGVQLSQFHRANAKRAKRWPHSMLTTSTHDTKRGEDTRARLAVLSEMGEDWAKQVQAWSRILRARLGDVEGTAPPDRNDEYLFYQLLLGTWPVELTGVGSELDAVGLAKYTDRIKGAMIKSMREAKVRSTWASPDTTYESAVLTFVESALSPEASSAFLSAFLPFQERVARLGVHNSLVQTVLKLTCPGVPDIYQGAELWDLSLVDPDNRRPVDFASRRRLLEEIKKRDVGEMLQNWKDGAIKLHAITRILALRAQESDLFAHGDYEPVAVTGEHADRVCAFTRRSGEKAVVVVAARFPVRCESQSGWSDTSLSVAPELGTLRDALTTNAVAVSEAPLSMDAVLTRLPVAVLVSSSLGGQTASDFPPRSAQTPPDSPSA